MTPSLPSADVSKLQVGFLGTGNMATALAKGFVANLLSPKQISGFDLYEPAREQFRLKTGASILSSSQKVIETSQVIVIAVKPHHVDGLLKEIRDSLTEQHLLLSIAAGVSLQQLQSHAGDKTRVVRVMPNTPCLVGSGACAFALGTEATPDDAAIVMQLLETVGLVREVPEPMLDAITGLSGSGPAYVYQIIEALSDGGVLVGLPREIATTFAAQTVLGAAKMVLETAEHPGVLKDAVTSPGGTTIAGLHALETGGLRGTLIEAVLAATQRSQELG